MSHLSLPFLLYLIKKCNFVFKTTLEKKKLVKIPSLKKMRQSVPKYLAVNSIFQHFRGSPSPPISMLEKVALAVPATLKFGGRGSINRHLDLQLCIWSILPKYSGTDSEFWKKIKRKSPKIY